MQTTQKIIATCSRCNATISCAPAKNGGPRTPKNWTSHEGLWCPKCWDAEWCIRGVAVPILKPLDRDWKQLGEALKAAWSQSTSLANWTVRQLAIADVVRTPDMKNLPPFKAPYLYPGARTLCPQFDTNSLVQLLQSVGSKYAKDRFDTIWTGTKSLTSFRYPFPYPIKGTSWYVTKTDKGLELSFRIDGTRISVAIGGSPWSRGLLEKLAAGDAIQGAGYIYSTGGGNRPGVRGSTPDRTPRTVMFRASLWMRRADAPKREGTLYVRSGGAAQLGSEPLLTYYVGGREDAPRYWFADNVRRGIRAAAERQERISHDSKAERRRPSRGMRGMVNRRGLIAEKYARMMKQAVHEATAIVVKYALRQGVARIEYDDTNRSFGDFQWHDLATQLEWKAGIEGLAFERRVAQSDKPAQQENQHGVEPSA